MAPKIAQAVQPQLESDDDGHHEVDAHPYHVPFEVFQTTLEYDPDIDWWTIHFLKVDLHQQVRKTIYFWKHHKYLVVLAHHTEAFHGEAGGAAEDIRIAGVYSALLALG